MDNTGRVILKVAALLMAIVGLVAMLAAWNLLLVSNIHSRTVIAMEFGGVLLCLVAYFVWRRSKNPEIESMTDAALEKR